MFKQKKLAIGVAAGALAAIGIITAVQAVHVNPDGTGQVLIFPYYNALPGYITNINLVNSTDQTKAVKVRVRDGKDSQDILNFNIYMSPQDVWTGTIRDKDGYGAFSTVDRTCAMPLTMSADCADPDRCQVLQPFDKSGITNTDTAEGYVEVIEMGVVTDPTLQAAVKHTRGRPANCQAVVDAWDKTKQFNSGVGAQATNMSAPTGGLFGSSAVLNLLEGATYAIDPVAVDNYTTQAQHYRPDKQTEYLLPSLASGNVTTSEVMIQKPSGASDMVVTTWNKQPSDPCQATSGSPCGTNPYPMSHALAASYVMNEYFVDPTDGYDGHTDWVVTFPMKKHGIMSATTDVAAKFDGLYDREEGVAGALGSSQDKYVGFATATQGVMSPQTTLNREVNVINFVSTDPSYNMKRTVFFSPATRYVNVGPFVHGWGRLTFPNSSLSAGFQSAQAYSATPLSYDGSHSLYSGVPTIGFAAVDGNVSTAPNARFGNAIPHKTRRY